LETSGRAGSVALLDKQLQITSEALQEGAGSAKTLAPAIDRLLKRSAMTPSELTAIALLTGPGSFTGLRVGVSTAKSMAYALKLPIVEVDSLDAIALEQRHNVGEFHVVMDAYRGQVFYASYHADAILANKSPFDAARDIALWKKTETHILDITVLLGNLLSTPAEASLGSSNPIQMVGPGCDRIRRTLADPELALQTIADPFQAKVRWSDGPESQPHAKNVAILGYAKWSEGLVTDPISVMPNYYRSSAAEEKRIANVQE